MAASMQGWRKKWFYIKDQKNSSSDHDGVALFDANKELKKLSSWDLIRPFCITILYHNLLLFIDIFHI
jgi:hypothetical protein